MKPLLLAALLCLGCFTAPAQETELFFSTQSGSPFSNTIETDQFFWNYSFGVEQYMADKVSLALSYRKMFDLIGGLTDHTFSGYNSQYSYPYDYSEDFNAFAIDLESKYFFDSPEEDWYLSSGISYMHISTDITLLDAGSYVTPAAPINAGVYSDSYTLLPLSLKAGHRSSSDTFVFDYFFGLSYNIGSGSVTHRYETYFNYNQTKTVTLLFGLKAGIKI